MSYCRLCLFAALIGGMFVRTDAAVRAAEKSMTLSQPVNAHFNTLSTPMTTPAPLFADINNSYQTASICFIGFGECGDNTDFSKSDDGFSLPDCASIGYPLTSCTPPGYPDKFCPYELFCRLPRKPPQSMCRRGLCYKLQQRRNSRPQCALPP